MRWSQVVVILCALCAPGFSPCAADEGKNSTVESVLQAWEQASSGLLGVGKMEHRRLYYLHHGEHSAHEIALLNEFRGPVSAADLSKRFEWSIQEEDGQVRLTGTPTDEVEKLFYKRVTVQIDAETHLPLAVQFAEKEETILSEPLAVVLSPRAEQPNLISPDPSARPIQVASREDEPPRRRPPVRVVDHVTLKPVPAHELPREARHALSLWETSAREIQSLKANVTRFIYEHQNHIEQRAVGEFSYSDSPTVQCTLKPAVLDPKQQSQRRTTAGEPYQLLPSPAEHWRYTASEIRFSHRPDQPLFTLHRTGEGIRRVSHEEAPVANDQIIPPWDMLFRVSAEEFAERFDIRVAHGPNGMDWSFVPRERGDLGQFREMRVLLDDTTCLPKAVKFICPAGDVEQVYFFQYTQVHRQKPAGQERSQ